MNSGIWNMDILNIGLYDSAIQLFNRYYYMDIFYRYIFLMDFNEIYKIWFKLNSKLMNCKIYRYL